MRARLDISPRLFTWVVRARDIAAAMRSVPHAAGPAVKVSRGGLEWLIGVPADGSMPFGGAFPTIIQWPAGPHPASGMPDLGCSLAGLEIEHPEGRVIEESLKPFFDDGRVRILEGGVLSMRAMIRTPSGERKLC